METRTKIIYGVFAASVIYGFYFHVIRNDDDDRVSSPSPPPSAERVVMAKSQVLETPTPEWKTGRAGDSNIDWERDPFKNKRHQRRQANNHIEKRRKLTPPRLTAVSKGSGNNMAVVDGQIVEVGGRIGPWRLIRIADNAALFDGPDGQVWVKLGG
jgi:hypothetical protein